MIKMMDMFPEIDFNSKWNILVCFIIIDYIIIIIVLHPNDIFLSNSQKT